MSETWSNWSRSVHSTPVDVERPWTTAALERSVHNGIAQGRRIKAVGSGHSFTGVAAAEDLQLELSNYTGIVAFDQQAGRVTLRSGTRLWQIPKLLAGSGWAMENLGDINQQSLAGAISTGTHGTGLTFGSIASQVIEMDLLTGTGQRLTVSADQDADVLDALRVSLGACGILLTITLQLVPEYDLRTVEQPQSLDWVLSNWQALHEQHDHFEFFWFGYDTDVQTKGSYRQAVEPHEQSRLHKAHHWANEELVTNGGLAVISHLGRLNPRWVPALNRIATWAWGSSDTTAHWSESFASSRRVRFNEMEYALPFETVPEVLRELRKLFQRLDLGSTFPLEVRATAPDTAWLATNHNQPTGYIAAHQYFRQDYREYFGRIEPVLRAAGGRPHWGKIHTLDAQDFPDLYPNWDKMLQLREQLDPKRVLTNPYIARVLGG